MFKSILALGFGLIPVAANAADLKPGLVGQPLRLSLTSELTDFSADRGSRQEFGFDLTRKFGTTNLVIDGATGNLKTNSGRLRGSMLSATIAHDWTRAVSTRTVAGFATNSPLFPTRSIMQEISYKPGRGIVLAASAKMSRYYGGVDVTGLSVGPAWYFRGGSVGYRFSRYDVSGLGKNSAHLVNARINDPHGSGSTQVWLGAGNSLHDRNILSTIGRGSFRSLTVRRIQPLVGNLALSVGVGRDWYETPSGKFTATRPTIGLVIKP